MSNPVISDEDYGVFRAFLEDASGIMLGDSKQYLISNRLTRLINQYKLSGYAELNDCLRENRVKGLREAVVDAMTTNETMWFRDIYPYDALKNFLLPELSKERERATRIWSAACSYGQEPYSISMLVQEHMLFNPGTFPLGVEILATDISSPVLTEAKQGCYNNASINRGMSEERKQRFFKQNSEGCWQITDQIRDRVQFRELNLQEGFASMGKFDLIFCRNVLIYFSHELKADILTRMAQSLNPGGYLVLGSSEAPNRYTDAFDMVRTDNCMVYQLKPGAGR